MCVFVFKSFVFCSLVGFEQVLLGVVYYCWAHRDHARTASGLTSSLWLKCNNECCTMLAGSQAPYIADDWQLHRMDGCKPECVFNTVDPAKSCCCVRIYA